MRILLVIDGMHPRSGGPPAVIAGSAIALAKRGHDVTVLSTAEPGDEPVVRETWAAMLAAGVTLRLCAPEGLRGLLGQSAQSGLISDVVRAADVVHLHGVWNPVLVVAGRIARRLGKPYFISVHGVFDRRAMERIKSKLLKKRLAMLLFNLKAFLNGAAGVIFGSAAEAEQSWLPTPNMRLLYVPNGADVQLGTSEPSAEDRARLHAVAPAVQSWSRTLLCRSRIHEEKGIDMLVAAFDRVAGDFPGTGLLIAGMRQDVAHQRQIEAMIASSAVANRMILTTELTGPSTRFLYKCGDIFVMPSIAEGFSMALIEGLANGRPLLITRYCHMQVVADEGAGMVVEPSVDDIERGLRAMLAQNDAELSVMGQRARALFEERYSWGHVAAQLEGDYAASVRG
jgi:glycosyltransferase involved in cell wall biosynthesis